jgi:hypothetical protein
LLGQVIGDAAAEDTPANDDHGGFTLHGVPPSVLRTARSSLVATTAEVLAPAMAMAAIAMSRPVCARLLHTVERAGW